VTDEIQASPIVTTGGYVSDSRIADLEAEVERLRLRTDIERNANAVLRAEVERLTNSLKQANSLEQEIREDIQKALNELGVPTDDYPAPVANAVTILRAVLVGQENP
jgi:hypothetical protein